jgi:hypothetical protein
MQISRLVDEHASSVLAALTAQIAVTDAKGEIIYVNDAWIEYARTHGNPPLEKIGVGANYIAACEHSLTAVPQVASILEGIQTILRGDLAFFASEYLCESPDEETWFFIWITPIQIGATRGLVIVHRRNQFHNLSAQTETQAQLTRELDALPQFSKSSTMLTAKTFGLAPLRQAAPEQFQKLTQQYLRLLELGVERRMYKIEHQLGSGLRQIANDLGFLKSSPRDVIDVHTSALNHVVTQIAPSRTQVYVEESRLMLIELMGYLTNYYRNFYTARPTQIETRNSESPLDGVMP